MSVSGEMCLRTKWMIPNGTLMMNEINTESVHHYGSNISYNPYIIIVPTFINELAKAYNIVV